MKAGARIESWEDFEREWSLEYAEWLAIAASVRDAVAAEVTAEQQRRFQERGETSVLETSFARERLRGLRLIKGGG